MFYRRSGFKGQRVLLGCSIAGLGRILEYLLFQDYIPYECTIFKAVEVLRKHWHTEYIKSQVRSSRSPAASQNDRLKKPVWPLHSCNLGRPTLVIIRATMYVIAGAATGISTWKQG
jgi:uncharacterized protein YllA (UPF0747 family)